MTVQIGIEVLEGWEAALFFVATVVGYIALACLWWTRNG